MKLSVIFGIIQMFAGTCLKGLNAIYFKEPLDFMFEFIPMVVFAASMFIYVSERFLNFENRLAFAHLLPPSLTTDGLFDLLQVVH